MTAGAFLGSDQVKPQTLSLLRGGNPPSLGLSHGICPVWVGFASGTWRLWRGAGVGGLDVVPRGGGMVMLHPRSAQGCDNPGFVSPGSTRVLISGVAFQSGVKMWDPTPSLIPGRVLLWEGQDPVGPVG